MVSRGRLRIAALLAAATFAAVPASGQVDLSGTWANALHEDFQERAPGPDIGDYLGLPINDEARAIADAWQISVQTLPERQCILYTSQYLVMGPQNLRILPEIDPISGKIVAYRMTGTVDRPPHTIWMDGRPHPSPYELHTSSGFTTGEWQGNILVAYTTHLKTGMVWRNGVPHSDQATIEEYWARHGNSLTVTMIVNDPVYFDEPFIRNATFTLDPNGRVLPEPCEPQVEIPREEGAVPHYLPGTNPFLAEVSKRYNIPLDTVRGGAATMYPEYRKQLKDVYKAPEKCERYCTFGPAGGQPARPASSEAPGGPSPPARPDSAPPVPSPAPGR
jgi:hypothetical protein